MAAYNKSVGAIDDEVFQEIYLSDFNTCWQSVLEALRNSRLDVSNREGGFIRTLWTDNTSERNFIDSYGGGKFYLKAQYRFRLTVSKGFFNGQDSVKVSVQKEQMVQHDVLEGWRPVSTDGVEEKTLLYRIGRMIFLKTKMAQLDEERAKKQIKQF